MVSTSKKLIILLMTLWLIFSIYSPVMADESVNANGVEDVWILWDLALARPLGVLSIGIGTAVFMVSLPFTVPSKSVKAASGRFIKGPIKFTFARPLGQWPVEY